jgi:hypothetical protein
MRRLWVARARHGVAAGLLCLGACGEHDFENELGHVGGSPLPDSGVGGAGGTGFEHIDDPVFPCDVQAVLEAKCHRCHTEPPENGAPFALLTWENTRVVYLDQPIYQRMLRAVTTEFMPLQALPLEPPVEPLTEDEKSILVNWLEAGGAPEDGIECP